MHFFLLFFLFHADAGSGQSKNKLQSGGGTSGERLFLNISEANWKNTSHIARLQFYALF